MGACTVMERASSTVSSNSSSVPRAPAQTSPPLSPGASTVMGDFHGLPAAGAAAFIVGSARRRSRGAAAAVAGVASSSEQTSPIGTLDGR